MDMIINSAKGLTAGASIILSYFFGEWSVLLGALILFVTFDYITGVIAAGYAGKLNAQVGFWGIPKKILIFGMVAIAHAIDKVYIDQIGEPIAVGQFQLSVMAATVIYYLFNEFISITENLGKMGMGIPTPLQKAISAFKEDSYKKDKGA